VLGTQDQQGVISVLDHGAGKVVHKRMQETLLGALHGDEAWEQVGDGEI
jgi:hypothetical protein